jgi:hypothetical protein
MSRELLAQSFPILRCHCSSVPLVRYLPRTCWSRCRNEGSSARLGWPMILSGRTNAPLFQPSRLTTLNLERSGLRLSSWRRRSLRADFRKVLAPASVSSPNNELGLSKISFAENGGILASEPWTPNLKYRCCHSSRPSPRRVIGEVLLRRFFFIRETLNK